VTIAQNRLMVNREERLIAGLQADNAAAAVEFLTNKFTNAELFGWMGNVLEQVYHWFLHQATATARLAALAVFDGSISPLPVLAFIAWLLTQSSPVLRDAAICSLAITTLLRSHSSNAGR
jgi:Tc toxin complex TcA C-terminal TcB-binding domain